MGVEMGLKISALLKQQNLSQKELAEKIDVTEATLSRYITGTREPKPEVLANIATALHTTSDYLLGIENEDYDHFQVCRMIARNASSMTTKEKKELLEALFGEE